MLHHILTLILLSHGSEIHHTKKSSMPECSPTTVEWEQVQPIFQMHCSRCHASPHSEFSADARKHLDMATVPFGGHHGSGLAAIVEALSPGKDNDVTMPPDGPELPARDIAAVVAWASCPANAWPSVRAAAPQSVVRQFHRALEEGDAQTARALLHPDVMIFEGGAAETSRAEYESHHLQADIAYSRTTARTVTEELVRTTKERAVVLSSYRVKGTVKGQSIAIRGLETMLLSRLPDGWRITHIHWSSRKY